jgi:hypothetical protein
MQAPLTCPTCGKTGERSGDWVRPGVATGDMMTGLDPENCVECWDTMASWGISPGILTSDGHGGQGFEPIPRSVPEERTAASR